MADHLWWTRGSEGGVLRYEREVRSGEGLQSLIKFIVVNCTFRQCFVEDAWGLLQMKMMNVRVMLRKVQDCYPFPRGVSETFCDGALTSSLTAIPLFFCAICVFPTSAIIWGSDYRHFNGQRCIPPKILACSYSMSFFRISCASSWDMFIVIDLYALIPFFLFFEL